MKLCIIISIDKFLILVLIYMKVFEHIQEPLWEPNFDSKPWNLMLRNLREKIYKTLF